MAGKKLRVAIVGMGLQGQRLSRAVAASKHATLVATASERESGSFEAVLKNKDVDIVVIATPNHKHAAQVIAAARAGKHILCEKPLALSVQEGRAIQKAVKKHNVRCFINYHLRAHPSLQEAQKIVAKKKLGDLVYIEMCWAIGTTGQKKLPPLPPHMRWRESVMAGGGTTTTRSVHLFDALRFITGKEATGVSGWSDGTRTRTDQTATTVIALGATPAVITTSKMMPDADNRIVIYGSKGKCELRDVFAADPHSMYASVFDYVAQALNKKKTPLAELKDGLAADAITEAFMRSVWG